MFWGSGLFFGVIQQVAWIGDIYCTTALHIQQIPPRDVEIASEYGKYEKSVWKDSLKKENVF